MSLFKASLQHYFTFTKVYSTEAKKKTYGMN